MDAVQIFDNADKWLFRLINQELSTDWLDPLMRIIRNQFTWVLLYLYLFFWFYKKAGKQFLFIIFFSLLTFALTDFLSAGILKPFAERLRPCYEPGLSARILVGCGGTYGMPSSHASNHFGLATFWFLIVATMFKKKWNWVWLWAIGICYAQVYVGKHYPADIFCGALLGTCTGFLIFGLLNFTAAKFLRANNSLRMSKPQWNY